MPQPNCTLRNSTKPTLNRSPVYFTSTTPQHTLCYFTITKHGFTHDAQPQIAIHMLYQTGRHGTEHIRHGATLNETYALLHSTLPNRDSTDAYTVLNYVGPHQALLCEYQTRPYVTSLNHAYTEPSKTAIHYTFTARHSTKSDITAPTLYPTRHG